MTITIVGTDLFWLAILCVQELYHKLVSHRWTHILSLCRTVEELFGAGACTPNLHLHGHISWTTGHLMLFGCV